MTPAQVATKFRLYIDEPDQTFVSDDDVETFLDDGYREFRNIVCDVNPMIYNAIQDVTLSDVNVFDLVTGSPSFLGATPTATAGRLVRINGFNQVNSDGDVTTRFTGLTNPTSLGIVGSSYYLAGPRLMFSRRLTGTFQMNYVPEGNVTWTGTPSTYIDDLNTFHDLIALLAYKQYAIIDGAENQPLLRQALARRTEFFEYLQARAHDGGDYVQHVPWLGR